jgi:hypothetical protein
VIHHCPECYGDDAASSSAASELSLLLSTSTTLAAFKSLIISKLPVACRLHHGARGYRLRRLIGQSKEGALYSLEELTLKGAELDEDELRVQIEHGFLPSPGHGEVRVSVKHPDTQQRTEHVLMLDLRRTVKDTKKVILEAAGLDSGTTPFCLYRTDVTWDERGKLFANENASLEKLGVTTGDNLWLEQGQIPSKGLVNLDFYLFAAHANSGADFCRQRLLEAHASLRGVDAAAATADAPSSSSASAASASAATESKSTPSEATAVAAVVYEATDSSPSSAASVPSSNVETEVKSATDSKTSDAAVAAAAAAAAEGMHRLFTLEAQQNDNLLDLKQALHSQPQLSHVPSIEHMRLRLFRGHQPGKVVPCNDQPLKKQGLSMNTEYTPENVGFFFTF